MEAAATPDAWRPQTARIGPIDNETKRRLTLGFISNWISKLSSSIITFVQVPVFLHFWSVGLYGEWVIVNSIPSYLAFTNIGFGNVAGNDMTMRTSGGDQAGALSVFQSCFWLIACICGAVGLLLGPILYFLPVDRMLKLHEINPIDARWIIFYLGLSVLMGQLEQLMSSAYSCVGRYPYGSFIKSMMSLVQVGLMLVPVAMGKGARTTALVYAAANIAGTIILGIMVRRDIPWLRYGWQYASWSEIRRMAGPAFAFMGFPLGNAFNLQGTVLAVQYALGPLDVVIFSTARQVSRVALQMVQMVNFTFWPELSLAYGAKNWALVRTLHRRSVQLALGIAVLMVTAMMSFGPWFLTHWTGGHVPPSKGLLAILLLVVVLFAAWSTSSTLQTATNQHQRLSLYYFCGTGVTVLFTYLFAKQWGLWGAAASLLISELVMNSYVLPNSLRLTNDTFGAFARSMLEIPPSLLRRLARSKPGLES